MGPVELLHMLAWKMQLTTKIGMVEVIDTNVDDRVTLKKNGVRAIEAKHVLVSCGRYWYMLLFHSKFCNPFAAPRTCSPKSLEIT
jgi:hypothetical protein